MLIDWILSTDGMLCFYVPNQTDWSLVDNIIFASFSMQQLQDSEELIIGLAVYFEN